MVVLKKFEMLLIFYTIDSFSMICAFEATTIKTNTSDRSTTPIAQALSQGETLSETLPLPRQVLPHELKNISLEDPVVFFPQPFSYPGYPVVLYL